MVKHARWLLAAAVSALALWFLTAGGHGTAADAQGKRPILPEKIFPEIVKEATKKIQDALTGKPKDKTTPALVRTNTMLIALAAQNAMANKNGAEQQEWVSLRDIALDLAQVAEGDKIDVASAKKKADLLAQFPKQPVEPHRKAAAVPLKEKFEIDEVMNLFDKANKGGHGIEVDLINLGSQKKPFTPVQMSDKLALLAYKTALLGEFIREHNATAKTKTTEWQNFTGDMQKVALELAEAAQAKNPKASKTAVKKLNDACYACHAVFKPQS